MPVSCTIKSTNLLCEALESPFEGDIVASVIVQTLCEERERRRERERGREGGREGRREGGRENGRRGRRGRDEEGEGRELKGEGREERRIGGGERKGEKMASSQQITVTSQNLACSHHSLWMVAPLLSSSSACFLSVWLVICEEWWRRR